MNKVIKLIEEYRQDIYGKMSELKDEDREKEYQKLIAQIDLLLSLECDIRHLEVEE